MLTAIAAVTPSMAIGSGDKLLHTDSFDMGLFVGYTIGKFAIFGRKTAETLPESLPGRKVIVASRSRQAAIDAHPNLSGVLLIPDDDPEKATIEIFATGGKPIKFLDLVAIDADRFILCGGGELYALFKDHITRFMVTHFEEEQEMLIPDTFLGVDLSKFSTAKTVCKPSSKSIQKVVLYISE